MNSNTVVFHVNKRPCRLMLLISRFRIVTISSSSHRVVWNEKFLWIFTIPCKAKGNVFQTFSLNVLLLGRKWAVSAKSSHQMGGKPARVTKHLRPLLLVFLLLCFYLYTIELKLRNTSVSGRKQGKLSWKVIRE